MKLTLRFTHFLLVLSFLFTSCASRKYAGTTEQQENTTFVVNSNVPDFQVNLLKGKNSGKSVKLEPTRNSRYSKTYTLDKLKFNGNLIRISADNYESEIVKVKIIPRGKAVKTDLLYGLITYFVPLIIDPFRSDFYKIAKRSKNIKVELRFSQYYMDNKFNSIASSSNIRDFNQFISNYPHSNKVEAAKDKIDLLELNAALQADSEEALTNYIASHPNSNYLEKAEEYQREMKSARVAYNKLREKGDLGDYIAYLEKYPDFKQSKLVIKEGLSLVSNEQKTKNVLRYYEGLFLKHGDILTTAEKKEIREKVNTLLENQLLIQGGERSSYESLKSMWNNALHIRSQYKELYLGKILNQKQSDIAHLFLEEFAKSESELQQKIINAKYVADFPEFHPEGAALFLVPAVTYNKDFNGTITLKNQDFLSEYNEKSWEGDPLKEFCCGSVVGDKEELVLKEGGISSYKIWDKKSPVAYFERFTNSRKFTRFTDGKLVEEDFYSYSSRKGYKYIYENGVNITLRDLDDKIDEVKKRLIQNDPRSAKSYIVNYCRNNFPENLSQNIEIKQLAKKCDDLIAEIEAKEEEERRLAIQAELARQEKEEKERRLAMQAQLAREEKQFQAAAKDLSISYVLARLKSPSSARLVEYLDPNSAKQLLNNAGYSLPSCTKVTRLIVDSQNSFGAMLRSTYFVFFKNGKPCHLEDSDSLTEVTLLGSSMQTTIIKATLKVNDCSCES